MDKLNILKAEKFRILKDAELKGIIGKGDNGCYQTGGSSCDGDCSGFYYILKDGTYDTYIGWGYGSLPCYYGSWGCTCGF